MGSLENTATVNLLEYLRSKTQIDLDSLDIRVATALGLFVDCTSNQAESYTELLNPQRASLLEKSVVLARQILSGYPNVMFEELAFEICMVALALSIAPAITGHVLVMTNPRYSNSTSKTVENASRFAHFCHALDPNFDISRLCVKVPATWEGLQACRKLKTLGIKTAATTLFTMEQAVLAAEAGCESIIPFVHELKVLFEDSYHDTDPCFELCVKAQRYYQQHSYPTHVKACSLLSVDEILRLAGVSALTLTPNLLETLAASHEPEATLAERSMFLGGVSKKSDRPMEHLNYVDHEAKFRAAFNDGRGQVQTIQAINIFCSFQAKGEAMMREASQMSNR